jgi:hypothetical protein
MAQKLGASAVVVADKSASGNLKSEALIFMTSQKELEKETVTIPSVFISKHDGDRLREAEVQSRAHNAHGFLRISCSFVHPNRTKHVDWSLWSSTFDAKYAEFHKTLPFQTLSLIANELNGYATFSPNYWIIPGNEWMEGGKLWHCDTLQSTHASPCRHWCTNSGKYCILVPEGMGADEKGSFRGSGSGRGGIGLTGQDILAENLRQICIYRWAREHHKQQLWWRYIEQFTKKCEENFLGERLSALVGMSPQCSSVVQVWGVCVCVCVLCCAMLVRRAGMGGVCVL